MPGKEKIKKIPVKKNNSTSRSIDYSEEVKRKLVHLSSLWMVVAILLIPKYVAAGIFAALTIVTVMCEAMYIRKVAPIYSWYGKLFGRMLRPEQEEGSKLVVSCAAFVLAAAAVNTVFFAREAAAGGMIIMLLGDTAAALFGRKYGKIKLYGSKSFEGFLAFLIAGWLGLALILMICGGGVWVWFFGFLAVMGGGMVEIYEKLIKLDDNFIVAVVAGLILQIGVWMQ